MSEKLAAFETKSGFFRGIRAALAYHGQDYDSNQIEKLKSQFSKINVKLLDAKDLAREEKNYDVLGFLCPSSHFSFEVEPGECLSIGFFSRHSFAKPLLKNFDAGVICASGPSFDETVFHFFESLTLPSLLNIDLADLKAIARGIGISFNEEDDSAREVIKRLPRETLVAKTGLLHFTCRKDVTLDEVYSISKAISARQPLEDPGSEKVPAEFRRVNIKIGMRVLDDEEIAAGGLTARKRISLTAILFGINR
jgi:hypothetical protein